MQTPTLPNHPIVYFGNHCLQNDVFQCQSLIDTVGQNYNVSLSTIARQDGATITDVREEPLNIPIAAGVTPLTTTGGMEQILHRNNVEEFKRRIDYSERFLRVMHLGSYDFVFAPTSDTTNVTLTNATGLTASQQKVQLLSHTHTFNANGSSTVTYEVTFPAIDLSAKLATANAENLPQWEFFVDIPKIEVCNSIDIKVGSDSSNYYGKTGLVLNYENKVLEQGKNILNVPHFKPDRTLGTPQLNVTESGSVNDSTITYLSVTFNLLENDSTKKYGFDGCIISDDAMVRNFVATPQGQVDIPTEIINQISTFPGVGFVCSNAYAQGTQRETIVSESGVTTLLSNNDVFFYGNQQQLPRFTIDLNAVTNLSNIRIRNFVENTQVQFDEGSNSWQIGDSVIFDAQTGEISRNGGVQETALGELPTFGLGNQVVEFEVVQSSAVEIDIDAGTGTFDIVSNLPSSIPGTIRWQRIAQSFLCTQTGTVTQVQFIAQTSVETAGFSNVRVGIHADNAGNPGSELSSTTVVVGQTLTTYTASLNQAVTNSTTYWVVFSIEAFDGIRLYGSLSNVYNDGQAKVEGGTWGTGGNVDDFDMFIVQEPTPATNIDYTVSYVRTY